MTFPTRLLLSLTLLCGLGTLPGDAAADCKIATAALAPPQGKVPARPVLRLLLSAYQAAQYKGLPRLVARSNGVRVPIALKLDASTDDLRTYRVEVAAASPGRLEVKLVGTADAKTQRWVYEIDPAWAAPAASTAAVTTSREKTAWACSHTKTTRLHFAATAWAYRVVAAPSVALLEKHPTRAFVLPRAIAQLWGAAPSQIPSTASVALGHESCLGHTFDWTTPKVVANVYALQPDGSEQQVNAAPLTLSAP